MVVAKLAAARRSAPALPSGKAPERSEGQALARSASDFTHSIAVRDAKPKKNPRPPHGGRGPRTLCVLILFWRRQDLCIPARGCQTTCICNHSWPLPPLADVSACALSVSRVSTTPQRGVSVCVTPVEGVFRHCLTRISPCGSDATSDHTGYDDASMKWRSKVHERGKENPSPVIGGPPAPPRNRRVEHTRRVPSPPPSGLVAATPRCSV